MYKIDYKIQIQPMLRLNHVVNPNNANVDKFYSNTTNVKVKLAHRF